MRRLSIAFCLATLCGAAVLAAEPAPQSEQLSIFRQRILPIFKSPKPSSCTECHLAGVDLKQYIDPDPAKTFASLVARGLVDVKHPDESKILTFINRKPEKPNLITDKIRQQEFEAFRSWIRAAAADPALQAAKPSDDLLGPTLPDEVIRHARRDRVLASFIENVWSEVNRCAACHSPDRNERQAKKFGERVSWIKLGDPLATMQHLIEADLVDAEAPAKSLILTKPTLQEEHVGGRKLMVGDRTYQQFLRFAEDYAAMVQGKYRTAADLPKAPGEVSHFSQLGLRILEVPEPYHMKLMQVDVYRWNAKQQSWSQDRWATGDHPVWGKKHLWGGALSVTAPRDSDRAAVLFKEQKLPPGRYLARVYVDQQGKLERDPKYQLGAAELVAEIPFESQWREGFKNATEIRFTDKLERATTEARATEQGRATGVVERVRDVPTTGRRNPPVTDRPRDKPATDRRPSDRPKNRATDRRGDTPVTDRVPPRPRPQKD